MKEVASWPPADSWQPKLTDFEFSPDDKYVAVNNEGGGFLLLTLPGLTLVGRGGSVNADTTRIGFLPDGKTVLLAGKGCATYLFPINP